MEVIGEFFGTTTASWSPSGVSRAPTISTCSPPEAAKTGGASPTPPMSTEPEAMACSSGGPEVKSDQLTWNGSAFSRPAADSTASAPVPFWSPTLSVTEDRFTTVDADGLAVLAPELPGGSRTSARASDARCASPPDSVTGQAEARSASPTSSSAVRAAACGAATRSPSATLASTVFHGTSRGSWNATDTGPATESWPVTSWSSPASARSSVDLPEPLRPISATNSPAAMSRSSPSSTVRPPNARLSPRTDAAGAGMTGPGGDTTARSEG